MIDPEEFLEARVPTPADLSRIIKVLRAARKWSQEQLAEIAGVTERTVQRVEKGDPSSLDTRRALAVAFELGDIDIFEKVLPFRNLEKLRAHATEIEKATDVISLTRIRDGHMLRTMIDGANSFAGDEIGGEISVQAREAFAEIVDYLRDYSDISDMCSMTQQLEVDRDLDALLQRISVEHMALGAGLRSGKFRQKTDSPERESLVLNIVYLVLAADDKLPSKVRAPKAVRFA